MLSVDLSNDAFSTVLIIWCRVKQSDDSELWKETAESNRGMEGLRKTTKTSGSKSQDGELNVRPPTKDIEVKQLGPSINNDEGQWIIHFGDKGRNTGEQLSYGKWYIRPVTPMSLGILRDIIYSNMSTRRRWLVIWRVAHTMFIYLVS
jgi:hypothetical protein